jgi:hypothetical protein
LYKSSLSLNASASIVSILGMYRFSYDYLIVSVTADDLGQSRSLNLGISNTTEVGVITLNTIPGSPIAQIAYSGGMNTEVKAFDSFGNAINIEHQFGF